MKQIFVVMTFIISAVAVAALWSGISSVHSGQHSDREKAATIGQR